MKIQHNGLFSYFTTHLFSIRTQPFDKIKMNRLFALIPEMDPLFQFHAERKLTVIGEMGTKHVQFPVWLLDRYHLTDKAFINRVKPYLPEIKETHNKGGHIVVHLNDPLFPAGASPFFTGMADHRIYFPADREDFLPISEVMVHYLLLYNLSMLCRYEPEWWGDLLAAKPDRDFPFIHSFLDVTAAKMPMLLGKCLLDNHAGTSE